MPRTNHNSNLDRPQQSHLQRHSLCALAIARFFILFALPASHAIALEPASPHPVVARLVTEGIAAIDGEGDTVKLTPAIVTPEMTAEQQKKALEKVFGTGDRFDRYLKDSHVAPQKIVIKTGQKLGDAVIRRIDLYFVAHASVKMIHDEGLMKDFMDQDKAERDEEEEDGIERYMNRRDRDPKVAAAAKDNPQPEPGAARDNPDEDGKPYINRYRFPILEKVVISGLIEGQAYTGENVLIDSALTPKDLLNDPLDPTVWQAIPRRAKGDADLSEPKPFRGLAGYLQATDLKFKPGTILVECHGFLVEPKGWFGGRSLLASKLPLVAQNNVRSFRRKLENAKASQDSN